MRRVVQNLRSTCEGSTISCRDEKILRVAALVHDLGHYPLSHVVEHVVHAITVHADESEASLDLVQQQSETSTENVDDIEDDTSWLHIASSGSNVSRASPAHHENLTTFLLETDDDLRRAIDGYLDEVNATDEVIDILKKDAVGKYKHQLLSSELDVDRLDYLVRDAYYTGVSFGAVEVDHLIRRMRLARFPGTEQMLVAVDERARPHVEHYLLARHFMYSQVVYHKVVTAFSALAGAVWIALNRRGIRNTGVEGIYEAVENGSYESFDDTWFWQQVAQLSREESTFSGRIAADLYRRRPPILVLEERRRGDQVLDKAKRRFERRRRELAQDSGLEEGTFFLTEQTVQMPNEMNEVQFRQMKERKETHLPEEALYIPNELPYIMQTSGEAVPITAIPGSLIQRLSANDDKEQIVRVFCLHDGDTTAGSFGRRVKQLENLCREEFDL